MNSSGPAKLVTLGLALVGGLALAASFPSLNLWPLAYLAVALLCLGLSRDSIPWALVVGTLFHLAFFLPLLWWLDFSVGIVPWFALSFVEAVIMGLVGPLWVAVRRVVDLADHPLVGAVAFALLYVGCESLRSFWPFGGFPWGRLAFSQADAWAAPLAYLGGQPLLSLAVALIGALLAAALVSLFPAALPAPTTELAATSSARAGRQRVDTNTTDSSRPRRALALVAAGCAIVLAAAPALIALPTAAAAGTLQVGAVQGNIADKSRGAETRMLGVIANHVAGTEKLARQVGNGSLDVVLWPENSADISPRADGRVAAQIEAASEAVGAPILVGAIEYHPDKTRTNVSLLWDGGRVIDEYAKQHPAPFAEYIPMRSFVSHFSDKVRLVTNEMVAGTSPATITLPTGRLGRNVTLADVICFEVAYDSIVRQGVDLGGQLIVVQTNNATFGRTAEGAQQLAMTRLRAIEHGRAAVQISTVGLSAMIAPDGKLLQEGGLFTAEQFHAPLPLRSALSPASRVSAPLETVTIIIAGLAALLVVAQAFRPRDKRQPRKRP